MVGRRPAGAARAVIVSMVPVTRSQPAKAGSPRQPGLLETPRRALSGGNAPRHAAQCRRTYPQPIARAAWPDAGLQVPAKCLLDGSTAIYRSGIAPQASSTTPGVVPSQHEGIAPCEGGPHSSPADPRIASRAPSRQPDPRWTCRVEAQCRGLTRRSFAPQMFPL